MNEIRAGQKETAKYYQTVTSLQGQERRYSVEPKVFWCVRTTSSKASREFRENVQQHSHAVVIASTNVSKLGDIDLKGGRVEYDGKLLDVVSAEYSIDATVVYIALA